MKTANKIKKEYIKDFNNGEGIVADYIYHSGKMRLYTKRAVKEEIKKRAEIIRICKNNGRKEIFDYNNMEFIEMLKKDD